MCGVGVDRHVPVRVDKWEAVHLTCCTGVFSIVQHQLSWHCARTPWQRLHSLSLFVCGVASQLIQPVLDRELAVAH